MGKLASGLLPLSRAVAEQCVMIQDSAGAQSYGVSEPVSYSPEQATIMPSPQQARESTASFAIARLGFTVVPG